MDDRADCHIDSKKKASSSKSQLCVYSIPAVSDDCVVECGESDHNWYRSQTMPYQSTSLIVQHNYHDHSSDKTIHPDSCCSGNCYSSLRKEGTVISFPVKLHEVLDTVEREGQCNILSWQPHGRCFVIHQLDKFIRDLLPQHFSLTKIASFQRQLNLYGFKRLTTGRDKSGYYHESFLRGRRDLARTIHRMKIKGTGVRAKSNPEDEPDFWTSMPWVGIDNFDNTVVTSDIHETKTQSHCPNIIELPLPNIISASSSNSSPKVIEEVKRNLCEGIDVVTDITSTTKIDRLSPCHKLDEELDTFMASPPQTKWDNELHLAVSDADIDQVSPIPYLGDRDNLPTVFSNYNNDRALVEIDSDFDTLVNEFFESDGRMNFSDLLKKSLR
jgi:HSF-type DNA-binding